MPPQTRAALLASHVGKPRSAETRAKIAAALRKPRRLPEYSGRECVYCGSPAVGMDHVIPRSHPKRTPCLPSCERVPACAECNTAKGRRTPEEWLRESSPTPFTSAGRPGRMASVAQEGRIRKEDPK